MMDKIRTSLEVGFADGKLPARLAMYRGAATRAIPLMVEFPFEDGQFDVVLMDGASVSNNSIKEAHRVLKPEGRLLFIVPERMRWQAGYTLAEVYAVVRDGFHIIQLERPSWWFLRRSGRTFTIIARKKNWRTTKCHSFRPSCWPR